MQAIGKLGFSTAFQCKPTFRAQHIGHYRTNQAPSMQIFSSNRTTSCKVTSNVSCPTLRSISRYYATKPTMVFVNDTNFHTVVKEAKTPIIVDCKADWCGPCKMLGPKLERAVEKANGSVTLAVLDIDESQTIADELRISSVPTVYAYNNGKIVDSFIGNLPEDQIDKFVTKVSKLNTKS